MKDLHPGSYSAPQVWVVAIDQKTGDVILLEKTGDKEIVKETVANIQCVSPAKWSEDWTAETHFKNVLAPKSCPFCQNNGVEVFWSHQMHHAYVQCSNCKAQGPSVKVDRPGDDSMKLSMDEAISRWGTR